MLAAHSSRTRSKVQLSTPRARLSRAATRRSSKPALRVAGIGAAVEPLPPTQPSVRNHRPDATQPRPRRRRTPIAGHQHRRRGVRGRGRYRILPEGHAVGYLYEGGQQRHASPDRETTGHTRIVSDSRSERASEDLRRRGSGQYGTGARDLPGHSDSGTQKHRLCASRRRRRTQGACRRQGRTDPS
ncbi:uncharacterized protein B0I36DRAFT_80708 [Microdochium trichocladiopsis]|uniref:Uncharacterized protein n=1 Tax=Microdochium trichocladiopsis TaxID=1682393 RepID=A0A9P9BGV7_9PEZI|nr:uncharacterized protein B0I36DRAFT_80708 [Microdochium trichocladiopsis]KAH7007891.1 hypothetical protein B0I36DRAFT_80708 [Microdochium trichocladiopsis]